jgi:hypothetical protein
MNMIIVFTEKLISINPSNALLKRYNHKCLRYNDVVTMGNMAVKFDKLHK